MVAAATAILKDIDLSNTSKNYSFKAALSGGEIRVPVVAGFPIKY